MVNFEKEINLANCIPVVIDGHHVVIEEFPGQPDRLFKSKNYDQIDAIYQQKTW